MKQVNTHRRANAVTRHDIQKSNVVKKQIEAAPTVLVNGKVRYLGIRKCTCGRLHWGARDNRCIGKQKEVAKMCPDCFKAKYGKNRPPQFRFLTLSEIEKQKRWYEVQGCKVYTVDPSSL